MVTYTKVVRRPKAVKVKNEESVRQLRYLLFYADLSFRKACELAGVKRPRLCYHGFYRGSTEGQMGEMRAQLLDYLAKNIKVSPV